MIMKFVRMWNRFLYSTSFNVFDVLSWVIVIHLAVTYSYWWFLLYIPTIIFSVHEQRKLEK
jgi:hypothetical protein